MGKAENPPAFPGETQWESQNPPHRHREPYQGMSLRDYFAGQALAGSLADPEVDDGCEIIVKFCYAIADEMLVEREKWNGRAS